MTNSDGREDYEFDTHKSHMVPQTPKGTYIPAIQSPLHHLMHLIIMKQNRNLKLFFVNPSKTWASS